MCVRITRSFGEEQTEVINSSHSGHQWYHDGQKLYCMYLLTYTHVGREGRRKRDKERTDILLLMIEMDLRSSCIKDPPGTTAAQEESASVWSGHNRNAP